MITANTLIWIFMLQFLHTNGCSNLYTSIGPCRKSKSTSVLIKISSISETECENQCNNNSACKGFQYSTAIFHGPNSCELSSSGLYDINIFCYSVFHVRHCPAGCFDTYTQYGPSTQGEGIIHVDTQKEKQCKSLCNANSLCRGFRHDTSDDSCELTVGNIAIHSGSTGSSFYQRHCPKDCSDSYSSPMEYIKSTAVYWENNKATEAECQTACNADSFCMAFYYRADQTLCQLSTSNQLGVLDFMCKSCKFYRRHCFEAAIIVTEATTLKTTTGELGQATDYDSETTSQQIHITTTTTGLGQTTLTAKATSTASETTLADISPTNTMPISTLVNNSTVQCVCSCKNSSLTLEETIEKRKRELQVNVNELSSSKRKLICVEDPRPSAQAIGHAGLGILVFLGCLVFVPDLLSVLTYIIRTSKM